VTDLLTLELEFQEVEVVCWEEEPLLDLQELVFVPQD